MKLKIRKGIFETNSSSIHSICISKNAKYTIPDSIFITRREFGWEEEEYHFTENKASYFFEMCLYRDKMEGWLFIKEAPPNDKGYIYGDDKYLGFIEGSYTDRFIKKLKECGVSEVYYDFGEKESSGYIDHCIEWGYTIVDKILKDDELFKSFLFNNSSCVITANDNGDCDLSNFGKYRGNKDFVVYDK